MCKSHYLQYKCSVVSKQHTKNTKPNKMKYIYAIKYCKSSIYFSVYNTRRISYKRFLLPKYALQRTTQKSYILKILKKQKSV